MPLFTNNHAAAAFWQKVAYSDLDDDIKELLPHVATEILQAVFHDEYIVAARRSEAALKAVGFHGKTEKVPGLKELATKLMPNEPASTLAKVADLITDIPAPSDEREIKNRATSIRQMRARTKKKS